MPSSKKVSMIESNRPVLSRSEMMIGLLVAPVAPSAMFLSTRSGSTESSQSLVPLATRDLSDMVKLLLVLLDYTAGPRENTRAARGRRHLWSNVLHAFHL